MMQIAASLFFSLALATVALVLWTHLYRDRARILNALLGQTGLSAIPATDTLPRLRAPRVVRSPEPRRGALVRSAARRSAVA